MEKAIFRDGLLLENGEKLSYLGAAYQTYGRLNSEKSNVVWICHALTANAEVLDWWKPLFEGENAAFPLREYFVVCVNVLGSCYGSTGPLSLNPKTDRPYYHDFPEITIRDMVSLQQKVAEHLGIKCIEYLVGASLGGQQALEWAIAEPKRFKKLVVIATNAKHSSWGIAFNESQRLAISNDPTWQEASAQAGLAGMKIARSIALLSYRSHAAYQMSQIDPLDKSRNFKASSYQRYQGEKLAKRFNAFSYYVLSQAMDSHNVGRARKSIAIALSKVEAQSLIIGIDSDLLFPVKEQRFLARHILNCQFKIIHSNYGHDAFLVEANKVAGLINEVFQPQLTVV